MNTDCVQRHLWSCVPVLSIAHALVCAVSVMLNSTNVSIPETFVPGGGYRIMLADPADPRVSSTSNEFELRRALQLSWVHG